MIYLWWSLCFSVCFRTALSRTFVFVFLKNNFKSLCFLSLCFFKTTSRTALCCAFGRSRCVSACSGQLCTSSCTARFSTMSPLSSLSRWSLPIAMSPTTSWPLDHQGAASSERAHPCLARTSPHPPARRRAPAPQVGGHPPLKSEKECWRMWRILIFKNSNREVAIYSSTSPLIFLLQIMSLSSRDKTFSYSQYYLLFPFTLILLPSDKKKTFFTVYIVYWFNLISGGTVSGDLITV